MAGFTPSSDAFGFTNDFPREPAFRIWPLPRVLSIPVGNVAGGVCGGMAFAVRDFFRAHRPVPADAAPPRVTLVLHTDDVAGGRFIVHNVNIAHDVRGFFTVRYRARSIGKALGV